MLHFRFHLALAIAFAATLCGCAHWQSAPYPIGIYGVSNTNDFPEVKAAGFNLVFAPATQHHLDSAKQQGLRVCASPGTSAGADFNALVARATVSRFDGHPALWGWYLVDEPDFNYVPPENVRAANQFLKGTGIKKPTVVVLFQGTEALPYANTADVTMLDRYPIPWQPLSTFSQHLRMVRYALGKKKPLVAVIQAFDWTYYSHILQAPGPFRPPSGEELRCMTYCALAEGATGVFYYTYEDSRWRIRDHPETWRNLKHVVREVQERAPLFQAEQVWWPRRQKYEDRSRQLNEVYQSSVTCVRLRISKESPLMPRGDYFVAVNTTGGSHRYSFRLPEELVGPVGVYEEGRSLERNKGWVTDDFLPYAVHVYGPLESRSL